MTLQITTGSFRWIMAAFLAPTEAVLVGAVVGYLLVGPIRSKKRLSALLIASVSALSAAGLWSILPLVPERISASEPMADFVALMGGTRLPTLFGGSLGLAAGAVLIGILEVGFLVSSGIRVLSFKPPRSASGWIPPEKKQGRKTGITQRPSYSADSVRAVSNGPVSVLETGPSPGVAFTADERRILKLFLFNRVQTLEPKVDITKSDGYSFQEIPGLDWEGSRLLGVLKSLERRGVLRSQLVERLPVCRACGSAALQLSSGCPDCRSVNLTRHQVIEHFDCGLIDKQEAFEAEGGELVCPKCHEALKMVGSDYRNLAPMYICKECNSMNKDLAQSMKCSTCGVSAPVEEEDERPLYAYELQESALQTLRQQIKPVEECASFFRSKGYTVVSPAVIVGRSGARHTFDLAIMVSQRESEGGQRLQGSPGYSAPQGIAIEILFSATPLGVDEVSSVYGKLKDLDCPSMIFAIPGLTESARSFADSSSIEIFEGKSLEEALARSTQVLTRASNTS